MPLLHNVICGDRELNENIKQEIINDQVFNENIEKTDHNNDSQLFQTGYELNLHQV